VRRCSSPRPKGKEAVIHFQTAQGLTPTGCTGPLTRARINAIEAKQEWMTTLSNKNSIPAGASATCREL
jgi:hypothetical protein